MCQHDGSVADFMIRGRLTREIGRSGAQGSALTRNVARFPSGRATQTRPPGLATLLVSFKDCWMICGEMTKAENQLVYFFVDMF